MKIEMIDVTEIARAMPVHVPGWQVGVSRRAWDECVGRMKADEGYRDGRLVDLLYFLWSTIPNLQTGLKGVRSLLVNGFGFWVSLAAGCVLTVALYSLMLWAGPRFGVRL